MRSFQVIEGSALEQLPQLESEHFDSCVTDPPYELGFMGKKWDNSGIAYSVELWRKVLRALKPGAYLLAFGGTRTYHRMVCAIEDAGFEIRDQIQWIYGSGFPKSLDVSKAIDKQAGAEREVIGIKPSDRPNRHGKRSGSLGGGVYTAALETITATDAAKQWNGWGTALKPAHEPICVARKPLSEPNVAANVLKYGTGAVNVDGCRIGWQHEADRWRPEHHRQSSAGDGYHGINQGIEAQPGAGRWPANVIHDGSDEVLAEFEKYGERTSGSLTGQPRTENKIYGSAATTLGQPRFYEGDSGSAARFFYAAKASPSERGEGNSHPTVKPVDLMQYLCRLVTPPGGTVLDPFTGSGSTGIAALREGFGFIGIEREADYVVIARRRIANDAPLFNQEGAA